MTGGTKGLLPPGIDFGPFRPLSECRVNRPEPQDRGDDGRLSGGRERRFTEASRPDTPTFALRSNVTKKRK
jgi:hypothetical protein